MIPECPAIDPPDLIITSPLFPTSVEPLDMSTDPLCPIVFASQQDHST